MRKFCIFVATTVLSWVGWTVGEKVGIGTAMAGSVVGGALGVYVGWRIHRDLLS